MAQGHQCCCVGWPELVTQKRSIFCATTPCCILSSRGNILLRKQVKVALVRAAIRPGRSRYLEFSQRGLRHFEHVMIMVLMGCGYLQHGFGEVPRSLTSEAFRLSGDKTEGTRSRECGGLVHALGWACPVCEEHVLVPMSGVARSSALFRFWYDVCGQASTSWSAEVCTAGCCMSDQGLTWIGRLTWIGGLTKESFNGSQIVSKSLRPSKDCHQMSPRLSNRGYFPARKAG